MTAKVNSPVKKWQPAEHSVSSYFAHTGARAGSSDTPLLDLAMPIGTGKVAVGTGKRRGEEQAQVRGGGSSGNSTCWILFPPF